MIQVNKGILLRELLAFLLCLPKHKSQVANLQDLCKVLDHEKPLSKEITKPLRCHVSKDENWTRDTGSRISVCLYPNNTIRMFSRAMVPRLIEATAPCFLCSPVLLSDPCHHTPGKLKMAISRGPPLGT